MSVASFPEAPGAAAALDTSPEATPAHPLLIPLKVGRMHLQHRIALVPLTRARATPDTLAPNNLHVEYYTQRATKGGLLITEATFISPETIAAPRSPGIFTSEQIEAWKRVTQAVHTRGAYIFCQLWHVGRIAHASFANHPLVKSQRQPTPPSVSSSEIPLTVPTLTYEGEYVESSTPRALETKELPRLVDDYVKAARNAIEAGFDGVEVHAASGYLFDQFLNDGINKRTDQYGGSIENRARFLLEVVDALIAAIGADRVSCRLGPHDNERGAFYQVSDSNPDTVYGYVIKELAKREVAYLSLCEPRWNPFFQGHVSDDPAHNLPSFNSDKFRPLYGGVMLGAGGYTPMSGTSAFQHNKYDLIGFGRWFIANPDLIQRIRYRQPLNVYNRAEFYSGEESGYTDYPTFEAVLRQIGYSESEIRDKTSRVLSDQEAEAIVNESKTHALKYELITQARLGITTSTSARG